MVSVRDIRRVAGWLLGLSLALSVLSPAVAAQSKDERPLTIRLIAPPGGQTVAGRVTFVIEADSDGLFSLQIRFDGRDYGSPVLDQTSGSFDAVVDTTNAADGFHTLQVVGEDQFGYVSRSAPVIVLVNNRRSGASLPVITMVTSQINFSPASSTLNRPSSPSQTSSKGAAAPQDRPRVDTRSVDMFADVPSICRGADPYVNDGGGRCRNGEWVPAEPKTSAGKVTGATPNSPAPSSARTTSGTAGTPATTTTTTSTPSTAGKVKTIAVPCSEPDPFAIHGGVGLCVDGTWLELWKGSRGGKRGDK